MTESWGDKRSAEISLTSNHFDQKRVKMDT